MSYPLEPTAQETSRNTAVDQYVRDLEGVPEPLRKLLGHTRVDLLESAFELRDQIRLALSSHPTGPEAFQLLLPLMEYHLKYHRLAQQYHQIDAKLAMRGDPPSLQRPGSSEKSAT